MKPLQRIVKVNFFNLNFFQTSPETQRGSSSDGFYDSNEASLPHVNVQKVFVYLLNLPNEAVSFQYKY